MKENPQESYVPDIKKNREVIPFLAEIRRAVERDRADRLPWEEKIERHYQQRFALQERDTNYPWPGASDMIIPMSDMLIDRMKPSLLNLITNVIPCVHFQPLKETSIEQARKAEHFMEWLLKVRMPDFQEQVGYSIDSCLQNGFGILKTIYEYRTENQYLHIEKRKLPPPLDGFFVVQKGGERSAELIYQMTGGKQTPVTKQEFDKNAKQIESLVQRAWNLDPEDSTDKRSIEKIMSFLRAGDESVTVKVRTEVINSPRVLNVDPMDLIVPAWTTNLENCPRITHMMPFTANSALQKVRDEGWNQKAVDMIIQPAAGRGERKSKRSPSMLEMGRGDREGIAPFEHEDLFEIAQTFCLFDIDGDGLKERCVMLWHPNSNIPIKFTALPYDHGEWPFTQLKFELNEDRFYSPRGIPEKIQDMEEEVAWQHRQKLNAATISTSPTFGYVDGSNFNPSKVRWIPGEFFRVRRRDDIFPLQVPDHSISFEREEAVLRNTIENYIGSPDAALSSIAGQGQDARTATEISMIQQLTQTALSYRGTLLNMGLKRVYSQVWDLWQQLGPEQIYVRVAGEAPMKMTKYEIQGDFDLVPRGTAGNTNLAMEEQKAIARLQTLAQVKPMVDADPQARWEVDMPQAVLDWFEKSDMLLSRRVMRRRSPEEQKQILQQRQQQQQAAATAQSNQGISISQLGAMAQQAEAGAPHGSNQMVDLAT